MSQDRPPKTQAPPTEVPEQDPGRPRRRRPLPADPDLSEPMQKGWGKPKRPKSADPES